MVLVLSFRRFSVGLLVLISATTLLTQHAKLIGTLGEDAVFRSAAKARALSWSGPLALLQNKKIHVEAAAAASSFHAAAGALDCVRFGSDDGQFLCVAVTGTPTWATMQEVCESTAPHALNQSVFLSPAHYWAGLRHAAHSTLIGASATSTFPVNFTTFPWDSIQHLGGSQLPDGEVGDYMTVAQAAQQDAFQRTALLQHNLILSRAYLFDSRFDLLLNGSSACEIASVVTDVLAEIEAVKRRLASDGRQTSLAEKSDKRKGKRRRRKQKRRRSKRDNRRRRKGSLEEKEEQEVDEAEDATNNSTEPALPLVSAEAIYAARQAFQSEYSCVLGSSMRSSSDGVNAVNASAFWDEVVDYGHEMVRHASTAAVSASADALFISLPDWCDNMDAIIEAVAKHSHDHDAADASGAGSVSASSPFTVYDDFGIGLQGGDDASTAEDDANSKGASQRLLSAAIGAVNSSSAASTASAAAADTDEHASGSEAAQRLRSLLTRACRQPWLRLSLLRAALAGVQRRMFTADAEMRLHDIRQMTRAAGRESLGTIFPPNSTIMKGLEKGNRALIQSGFNPPGSHSVVGAYLTAFNVIVTESGGLQTMPADLLEQQHHDTALGGRALNSAATLSSSASVASGSGLISGPGRPAAITGPTFPFTGRHTCEGEQRDPLSPRQLKSLPASGLPVYDEVVVLTHRYEWNIYHWTAEVVSKLAPLLDYLHANPHVRIHVQTTGGQHAPFREGHLGLLGLDWKARTVRGYLRARVVHYADNHMCGYPYALWSILLRERYRAALGLPTPPTAALQGRKTALKPSAHRPIKLPPHLAKLDLRKLKRNDPRALAVRKHQLGAYVPLMPTHRRSIVFLRRKRTRRIINEGRLFKKLSKLGNVSIVEVNDWELPDPVEAFRLFAGADVIIGAHGAGLANAIVSSPGACVVEFMPYFWFVPCYWRMAGQLGLRHHVFMVEGRKFSPIEVDVSRAVAALRWCPGAGRAHNLLGGNDNGDSSVSSSGSEEAGTGAPVGQSVSELEGDPPANHDPPAPSPP